MTTASMSSKAAPARAKPRGWLRWSGGYHRHYQRYDCRLEARVTDKVSRVEMTGLILDLSNNGCLFRPKLHYLLYRAGDAVWLNIGSTVLEGVIVNTTPRGYGVSFVTHLDDDVIASFLLSQEAGRPQGN